MIGTMPPRKKPKRTGVPMSLWLPEDVVAGLEQFLDAQRIKPSKTEVVIVALQEFLQREVLSTFKVIRLSTRTFGPHSLARCLTTRTYPARLATALRLRRMISALAASARISASEYVACFLPVRDAASLADN